MEDAPERHVRLIAGLRWQVFRNSLRLPRGRLELAASVLLGLLGAAISLGIAAGVAVAAYSVVHRGRPAILHVMLWSLFVFWQVSPIALEASRPALDFRELARFPIRFRVFALLHTAYGLADPATLLALLWLAGIGLGTALARPQWTLRVIFILALFALVNVLLSRALFGIVEQVMRTRRGRERLIALLLGLAAVSQVLIYGVLPRISPRQTVELLAPFARTFPPSLAGSLVTSNPFAPWPWLLLAGWAAAACLLLRRQLLRLYRGEAPSEGAVVRSATTSPGWKLPLLGEPLSAAVEKEFRYSLRDARTLLAFLTGPIAALIVLLASDAMLARVGAGSFATLYVGLLSYSLVMLGEMSYNSFCYESDGFQRWRLLPIPLRTVFIAKNIVAGGLLGAAFLVTSAILALRPGFPWKQAPLYAAGFAFAALAMMASGNLFSAWLPTRIEYGTMSAKKASAATVLLGFASKALIIGCFALVFYATRRWQMDWLPALAFPLLMGAMAPLLLLSQRVAASHAERRGDRIAAILAG